SGDFSVFPRKILGDVHPTGAPRTFEARKWSSQSPRNRAYRLFLGSPRSAPRAQFKPDKFKMFFSRSCVSSSEDEGSPLGRALATTSALVSPIMYGPSHAAVDVEEESQLQTQLEQGSEASANVSDADSDYEDSRVSARPNFVAGAFLCEMETQAVSDNAMQAHHDNDADLLKCLIKYKKQILQTHWLLVGFAGSELRESTKQVGFKSHEQGSYMLDAYRR
ncbi:hypothetical protein B484DRAFT_472200, partial [Ochromonadaceae sp. CCMP2298]